MNENKNYKYTATMELPKDGKKLWTTMMQSTKPWKAPEQVGKATPLIMAVARFEDGTQVLGGVVKSDTPDDYNILFMWVFDKDGNRYPDWPIDVTDFEDFSCKELPFSLHDDVENEYLLKIVERSN